MEKSVKCCYLVCAGEMKTPLNIEKKPFDKIIAVDGGLKKLRQAGIVPDLIAGDFDSLGFKPETGKLLCLPVEKDRKSTRLNSSHNVASRMPSSA